MKKSLKMKKKSLNVKKKNLPTKRSLLLICLYLAGCSYKTQFDCPLSKGLSCASLSKVNRLVDQGEIHVEDPPEKQDSSKKASDKKSFEKQTSNKHFFMHPSKLAHPSQEGVIYFPTQQIAKRL